MKSGITSHFFKKIGWKVKIFHPCCKYYMNMFINCERAIAIIKKKGPGALGIKPHMTRITGDPDPRT